jgi:hypothetical protein
MPSINLDLNYFGHPKTRRLAGLLGPGAAEYPIRLWVHAAEYHYKDGTLMYPAVEIEGIVGWTGNPGVMVAALVKVGFLEKFGEEHYQIHDWLDHAGHIVEYKEKSKQMHEAKKSKRGDGAVSTAVSNATSNATSSAVSSTASNAVSVAASSANAVHYNALQDNAGGESMSRDINSDVNQSLNHTRDSNKHIPAAPPVASQENNGTPHTPAPPFAPLPSNGHTNGARPQAALAKGVAVESRESARKADPLKGPQFPLADIEEVVGHFLTAKGITPESDTVRRAYIKSLFYDAKDLLAMSEGNVKRARNSILDMADWYRKKRKDGWTLGYILKDYPEWNEERKVHESKAQRKN